MRFGGQFNNALFLACFLLHTQFVFAQTAAPLNTTLELEKDCYSGNEGHLAYLGKSNPQNKNIEKLNLKKCSFQRLLKEANNVDVFERVYALVKLQTFEKEAKTDFGSEDSTKLVTQRYLEDGTCLQNDTVEDCHKRMKRIELEARLRFREDVLKNNKTRADLVDAQDEIRLGDLKDSSGGASQSGSSKSKSILSDVAAWRKDPAKMQAAVTMQPDIPVQQPKLGDTFKESPDSFKQIDKVDVSAINQQVAAGDFKKEEKLEVEKNAEDAALSKGISDIGRKFGSKIDQEQSRIDQVVKKNQQTKSFSSIFKNKPVFPKNSISELAFNGTIDFIKCEKFKEDQSKKGIQLPASFDCDSASAQVKAEISKVNLDDIAISSSLTEAAPASAPAARNTASQGKQASPAQAPKKQTLDSQIKNDVNDALKNNLFD